MTDAQREALLTLLLTPGLGQTLTGRLLDSFGDAPSALRATPTALAGIRGISADRARQIHKAITEVRTSGQLQRELDLIEQHRVQLISFEDEIYPRPLKLIPDPPRLLYVRGKLQKEDALAVGLVGSRKCSQYGREQAERFAAQLSQAGLCIVSGGALGIDGAAHRAALRVNGRTIAVIGSGLCKPYPDRHRELFDAIADGHGAVVSELPMTAPPIAENFPRRNRIISGLSLGIVVVEAALRSGALITARQCVEEHGRECMAIPGRVDASTSAGCHKLIRDGGATLITCAGDVLEQLGEAGNLLQAGYDENAPAPQPPHLFEHNLTDIQRTIVAALDSDPRHLDQIATQTGLEIHIIQSELTMLQIRGLVTRNQGRFARKH